jgi:hypothetical protein
MPLILIISEVTLITFAVYLWVIRKKMPVPMRPLALASVTSLAISPSIVFGHGVAILPFSLVLLGSILNPSSFKSWGPETFAPFLVIWVFLALMLCAVMRKEERDGK